MGVSGSGKTTIARALAREEGWILLEGDQFHPASNVAKMKAGAPLSDEDRWPWLRAIAAREDELLAAGQSAAVLVYLCGSKALIAERMAARRDHFMPPALLDSQFATLEEPSPDEHPIIVDIGGQPDAVIQDAIRQLKERMS
jgi:gluconate kinase